MTHPFRTTKYGHYACNDCGRIFHEERDVKNHLRDVHPNKYGDYKKSLNVTLDCF